MCVLDMCVRACVGVGTCSVQVGGQARVYMTVLRTHMCRYLHVCWTGMCPDVAGSCVHAGRTGVCAAVLGK